MNDDARKKVIVVVLALLVLIPVIGWRSWQAIRETGGTDWDRFIKEERLASAPGWFHPAEVFGQRTAPKGPALRLATLRFLQRREHLESIIDKEDADFPPLYARARAMGANLTVNESID